MKYHIITFGCQMNKSDSERIASVLEKIGYKKVPNENEADMIVINMCSVRQSAVDRVYGLTQKLRNLKAKKPGLKTILTGCFLKGDKRKFKERFDLILNIKDLPNLSDFLLNNEARSRFWENYLKVKPKFSNNFSAFVPIMTGCNNFCAYCVVPYTRGRETSRPADEILLEVKNLIERDFKEIWLLGQKVNSYYSPIRANISQTNFPKLLKQVNDIEGDFWIRFTSSHPKDFSDELIETMAECEKVTPYLNLPVQSGDDEILKKMNRGYTTKKYKSLIKKIRAAFKKYRKGLEKEIALSTDIIVGFPGETKKQFENTVKLFKEIKFNMAYIAKYSPRPGTAAAQLKDDVPAKEKERRWKILTGILRETALKKNKKYIGKEVEALIESGRWKVENKKRIYFGKSRHYKTVKIELPTAYHSLQNNLVGQFIKVKIIDALPWGLKGKPK